jgi:predicted enzyme related to lactoylglutathione lyase
MSFESQITFLYYKNLDKAEQFYKTNFGFKLVIDQGWAKIFEITKNGAHLGLVDEKKGFCDWHKEKTVMVTLVTKTPEEVDRWYKKLKQNKVKMLSEPHDVAELNIRCFLIEDPEGYVIEIQHFL